MTAHPSVAPLGAAALPLLLEPTKTPGFDPSSLRPGIVHIGVGGFHRAHLATYANELAQLGHLDWGIVGAGVLPTDARMADVLASQDYLYTLITRGPHGVDVEIIASLIDFIHAVPDPARLIAQIASPTTQIVSLTITEGGYPVDDETGAYRVDSPVAGPDSAFGLLARALDRRRQEEAGPITILSCDNIMSNGEAAQTALLGEAARLGPDLQAWIRDSCSFPNSMVDRITPATSPSDIEWLVNEIGIEDQWPVVTEPFRQWVVEDSFAGERPPLELLDVIVTDDVQPYELMKLRLLNAGHSCLAYLAALVGIETVHEALATEWIHRYLEHFLRDEAQPVLPDIPGIDVDAYIDSLIERFSNPQIGDQIARLCLDGTAKFPKFLLPTVHGHLRSDGNVTLSALALAAWCEYLTGPIIDGVAIVPSPDPMLAEAQKHAKRSLQDPAAFLEFEAVFPEDLALASDFVNAFSTSLLRIRRDGVPSAVAATLAEAEEP